MDVPPDRPWAEHEKVALLAEILKAAPVKSNDLFRILQDLRVQPRWEEVALPWGRSLKSCQFAYSNLQSIYSGHPIYPGYSPFALPVEPLGPRRLPPPVEGPVTTSGGRILQPRPPGGLATFSPSWEEQPAKKKRGRPTNAEMARKAEEAAARGEPYPPPQKRPRPGKPDQPSPKTSTTTEAAQASGGSPATPATALPGERIVSTPTAPPTAPSAPGSASFLGSPSSSQPPSVRYQEATIEAEREGRTTIDEPQKTPSQVTTTSMVSPGIPARPAPREVLGTPSIPLETSREEPQARTETITTTATTTLPEPKKD